MEVKIRVRRKPAFSAFKGDLLSIVALLEKAFDSLIRSRLSRTIGFLILDHAIDVAFDIRQTFPTVRTAESFLCRKSQRRESKGILLHCAVPRNDDLLLLLLLDVVALLALEPLLALPARSYVRPELNRPPIAFAARTHIGLLSDPVDQWKSTSRPRSRTVIGFLICENAAVSRMLYPSV